jgi:ATP-binding cassette subfamily B protein/subfamily B ATP-binding cassette protein MsbA
MRGFAIRVLSYLPPYRQKLLWALVQVLLISAFEMLKPWPLKIIIDSVLGGQPPPWGWPAGWSPEALLLGACAALVLAYAALAALAVLNNYTTISVGQRMVSKLRSDLYGHLHRLSLAFHSRAQVGDLIYRVTADTFGLQSLTMNCLFPAVSALMLLAGMGLIMFQLDWKLTLVALGVCPALLMVIARLNSRISRLANDVRRRESEVYAVVQQSMSMMRVIQAFTREDDEHRRFMDASGQSLAAGLRLYTLQTVYSGVVNVIIALGTAAVVWMGARHVLDGSLSIGTLVIFISYLASLYGPINSMFQTYAVAQGSRAAVQRVFDVLDVEGDLKDSGHEIPAKSARGEVAWEDVSFGYVPGHPVLSGVNFRVRPGQKVAVVGPTGAGKSTLLSLLPRFYDPWAGRVLVDGVDAREYRLASLRRQIAMVLQPPLVFNASVHDNIAFGHSDARREEVVASAQLAGVDATIMRLPEGYDTIVGEQGVTLSEGEKQRLTIARAILRDSPILILDEPTSALDSETEALIMQGLECLTAGRTTFIIAHRLATVRKADLIVVLRDGRIVEQGNFETLMDIPGAFASLYRLQAGARHEDPLAIS